MHKVLIIGQIEDAAAWEGRFRTHAELFKSQTATVMDFTATDQNEFAICAEVDDLNKWREILNSPATEEAMAHDGVKRETVKVYELDKKLEL